MKVARRLSGDGRLPRPLWLAVALLHLLPFATRPALIGGDEPHYALMAHSIAVDGDLSIEDDYDEVSRGAPWAGRKRAGQTLDRHLRDADGVTVFAHPLGLPLLAAPLLALQDALSPGSPPDLPLAGLTLAITFTALVCGIRLLGEAAGDVRLGAAAGLALYFSTPLWFYGRTFMTEPYMWSWIVLALASQRAGRPALASVFLGLALAMKETALLIVAPILVGSLAVSGVRRAWPLGIGPALFAPAFVVENLVLGLPALATFQPYRLSGGEGLIGFLVDPQRGLLWFAPLALVAMAGWRRAMRPPGDRVPAVVAAVVLVAYYLGAALWIDWRGGSGYGPRLLVPALPAAALPLVALMRSRRGPFPTILLAGGFAAGFSLNLCAASRPVHAFWSASAPELLVESPIVAAAGAALALAAATAYLRGPLRDRGGI